MNRKSGFHLPIALSLLVLGSFLFYAALHGLPSNWHIFLLSGSSQAWTDFFPLAPIVVKWLEPSLEYANGFSQLVPLHLISATVAFLAFVVFFSLPALRCRAYYSFFVVLVFLGQPNSLWLMSFSLATSLSFLGLVLIIKSITLPSTHPRHPLVVPAHAFVGYLALLASSPLASLLVLAGLLYSLLRKQFIALTLPIALAAVASLLLWPAYYSLLSGFYSDLSKLPFAHLGNLVPGESLPFHYAYAAFIRTVNPLVWILPLAAIPFAIRHKKSLWKNPWFHGIAAIAAFLIAVPQAAGKSAHFLQPLSLPLLYIGLLGFNKLAFVKNKRWGFVPPIAATLLLGYPGLLGLTRLSPYQYLVPSAPFTSLAHAFTQHHGDYLNMAGNALLIKEISNLSATDTLAANFETGAAEVGPKIRSLAINKTMRSKYTRGVMSRAALSPAQNASTAFPPPLVLATESYAGISLAITTRPAQKVQQAFRLMDLHQYGNAVTLFKGLTAQYPASPEAYYGLAKSRFLFNLWDESLQTVQVGLSLFPSSRELQVLQGEIFRKQNRNQEATKAWKKVLEMYPLHQRTLWLMAEYYYRVDSLAQAQDYAERASQVQGPLTARIQKFQQLIAERTTDPRFDDGIEQYFIKQINTFRSLDHDSSRVRLSQTRQSIQHYIDLDSTNAPLRSHLGITLMMSEHYPQAALAFDKAIEINPNYPQMREYLAIARMNWAAQSLEQDSAQAAIFHYQIALDYQPNDNTIKTHIAYAYNQMAKDYLLEKDYNSAYGYARAALSYDPNHAPSYLTLGHLQLSINQADSAEIAYVRAYQLDKESEESIQALIDLYKRRGDTYKVKVYAARLLEAKRKRK